MMRAITRRMLTASFSIAALVAAATAADEPPSAMIDGSGPGWITLGAADFAPVNGDPDTWTWEGGMVRCSGKPIGVTRSTKEYENFELVATWRHLQPAGNSGVFAWTPASVLEGLPPGKLPGGGIEVQVLDNGYATKYEAESGKKADWFTTHGDVFPVGTSKMTPIDPKSAKGPRSFPTDRRSKGVNEWNHYYIRAINGELRLWVNGREVSGGRGCEPRRGYVCLESEGSPVEFRDIRIRELP